MPCPAPDRSIQRKAFASETLALFYLNPPALCDVWGIFGLGAIFL